MSAQRFLTVLFLLLASLASAGAAPRGELTGILTQAQGVVQATGPGVSGLPRATPWQVLQAGTKVHVPAGGAAGIVCSNRRFVRLQGPASWSLSEAACAAGKELTRAEYALVAPEGGRFKVVEEILVLERILRGPGGDDPLAPLVLRPRNTTLRSPRPTLQWLQMPSATDYEIRWTGRGAPSDQRLRAGEVTCEDRDGMSICSLPWPEERPDLPPGEILFLQIAARSGIADPWRMNDFVEVRTQKLTEAAALERDLSALESLGLQGAALDAARAGLLAERGLWADAADLYRRTLAAAPAPELRITLADLELAMGLHVLAEARYRDQRAGDPPAVRAASAFGLGRIASARNEPQEAEALFHRACELYSSLGLEEEAASACLGETQAQAAIKAAKSAAPPGRGPR